MSEMDIVARLHRSISDAREAARDMTAEPEEIRNWADVMEAAIADLSRMREALEKANNAIVQASFSVDLREIVKDELEGIAAEIRAALSPETEK